MKSIPHIVCTVLLSSVVVAQNFILTSNDKVEVSVFDPFGAGQSLRFSSDYRSPGNYADTFSPSETKNKIQILGIGPSQSAPARQPQHNLQLNVGLGSGSKSGSGSVSVSPSSGTVYAKFEEPSPEIKGTQVSALRGAAPIGSSSDPRVQKSLSQTKWISGAALGSKMVSYWSPCFYNSCPDGLFTLEVQAVCEFGVYLVDQHGDNLKKIGSGQAWWPYSFNFTTPCGKHQVKIVLNCTCPCLYVRFNLYQDQSSCFNCPDIFLHTYNPQTCKCECINSCAACQRPPQVWIQFPKCACGCSFLLACPKDHYYDKKDCTCKCLPNCCPTGKNNCKTC